MNNEKLHTYYVALISCGEETIGNYKKNTRIQTSTAKTHDKDKHNNNIKTSVYRRETVLRTATVGEEGGG